MNETCTDNRFEIIKELKDYIISATNIETSPDEMKVLDNFCFRLWQLGLTLQTKEKAQKYDLMSNQLGCPLEVYIKATLGRFWVENEQKYHSLQDSLIIKTSNGEYAWCIGHDMSDYRLILLKDYKKTWWLKENREE